MKPAFPVFFLSSLFILFCSAGALLIAGSTVATHPFRLLFGLMFFIGAVAIAARPAVYILTRKSGSLFFPQDRSGTPPPAYSTAEACRVRGDFTEALRHYESVITAYPQEVRAYVAVVEMALENIHDSTLAKRTLDRGRASIASEGGRRHLQESYDEGVALREKKERRAGGI